MICFNLCDPNVAIYAGCRSIRGRVSGIFFKRYVSTLDEKVNPRHLCKSDFLSTSRLSVDDVTIYLNGLLAGIRYLYSLNIIYNDVKPSNIFLDEDGTWVLGDFDSCLAIGKSLQGIKRTYGWHDPQVQIVSEKNDLDAFTELQYWLIGSSTDDFLFKRG